MNESKNDEDPKNENDLNNINDDIMYESEFTSKIEEMIEMTNKLNRKLIVTSMNI